VGEGGFPSLIGSSKTPYRRLRQRVECLVSIPHRKFKNLTGLDTPTPRTHVSIPHRKFKNALSFGGVYDSDMFPSLIGSSKTGWHGCSPGKMPGFPSLIGSSKTELEGNIGHVGRYVSIPHRKFKNKLGDKEFHLSTQCFHPS